MVLQFPLAGLIGRIGWNVVRGGVRGGGQMNASIFVFGIST